MKIRVWAWVVTFSLLLAAPAYASTTSFSWGCQLDFDVCSQDASTGNIGATISFDNTVPLDGEVFSGPATLSVHADGLSQVVQLPSNLRYAYRHDPLDDSIPISSKQDLYFITPDGSTAPVIEQTVVLATSSSGQFGNYIDLNYDYAPASATGNPSQGSVGVNFNLDGIYAPPGSFHFGSVSGHMQLSAPPSLYIIGGTSGLSLSGNNTNLNLSLVVSSSPPPNSQLIPSVTLPNGTSTLQQAAAALHFQGFEWVQTVTSIPDPSPFYECNETNCSSSTQLTSGSVPFLDPPPNGYTYCGPNCSTEYPFYYNLSDVLGNPSLCVEHNGSQCIETLEPNAATLNFFDAPSDPCIVGANGAPSVAWTTTVGLLCGGRTSATNSPIKFTTELVGVLPGYQSNQAGDCIELKTCVALATAKWSDNFNGWSIIPGVGGIARTYSDEQVDITSGTGGVTSLNLSAGVPEPPTYILLVIALAGLRLAYRHGRPTVSL